MKCLKKKPGPPTGLVSTDTARVQDNASKFQTTDQEMNKPFSLALSVPHDAEMSATFPCMTIEADVFPFDCDNKTMHATVADKITDMLCTR